VKGYYALLYPKQFTYGRSLRFKAGFKIMIDGGTIEIGDHCSFNNNCSLTSLMRIKIGDDCIFGENVKVYDHNHAYRDMNAPIRSQGYTRGEVTIGSHCWIGSDVTILKGARIGDNCVIGAHCLIFQDVPPGTVVRLNVQQVEIPRK
jgi:acetyltransferase-like isoleucine patch superfamily enzyme